MILDGKFTLKLGDQERTLIANFLFVETLERRTLKKPILKLLSEAGSGMFGITDIADVIYAGLLANRDTRLKPKEIGELVFGNYPEMLAFCVEMLAYSIGAEKDDEDPSTEDSEKKN